MNFEKDRIYHVYNQGNNRKKIFLTRSNYQLFHKKMDRFICPYADILAWCLMPNQFHLMIFLKGVFNFQGSFLLCKSFAIISRRVLVKYQRTIVTTISG